MSAFRRKYATGTGADLYIPLIKYGLTDYAESGDWTPASGDVKISKDGGSQANIGTLPVWTNGAWKFVFTDAELTGKDIVVKIVDSATKAVEDDQFNIETEGHASAKHPGVNLTSVLATALTESNAGDLANNIKKFFDVNPTSSKTIDDVGIGSLSGLVLLSTTIDTINSQTDFDLTAGSDIANSYVGQIVIITDATNNSYPIIRWITAYDESNLAITIDSAPDFTAAAGDGITILSIKHPYAALVDAGLDHLVKAAVTGTDVTDGTIIAQLVSKSATADYDDFDNETESLQAIRDRGDAAWGFSGSQLTEVKVCQEFIGVHFTASQTLYFTIHNEDGQVFDFDDDTFKALGSATTPYIAATERTSTGGTGHSQYFAEPDWSDIYNKIGVERVTILAMNQAGGSPAPATDAHISHPALAEITLGTVPPGEITMVFNCCVKSTAGSACQIQAYLEHNGTKIPLETLDASATISATFEEVETPANTFEATESHGGIVNDEFHLAFSSPGFTDDRLQEVDVVITVDGVAFAATHTFAVIG